MQLQTSGPLLRLPLRALALSTAFAALALAETSPLTNRLRVGAWSISAGRRFLSLGDERLIGANTDSRCPGPAWDAIDMHWSRGPIILRGVEARDAVTDEALSAVQFTLNTGTGLTIEPYWFRLGITHASGVRVAGARRGFDFNIEVVREPGSQWAGHWELGRSTGSGHVGAEYNYATMEFDELVPAALNKYGTEDPFAWNNTRNFALNWDRPLRRKLEAGVSFRAWWTADGTYLGKQAVGAMSYTIDRWRISAGISGSRPYLALGLSLR